jgi:hypothetical protein
MLLTEINKISVQLMASLKHEYESGDITFSLMRPSALAKMMQWHGYRYKR